MPDKKINEDLESLESGKYFDVHLTKIINKIYLINLATYF
jgi:hypothetical protein